MGSVLASLPGWNAVQVSVETKPLLRRTGPLAGSRQAVAEALFARWDWRRIQTFPIGTKLDYFVLQRKVALPIVPTKNRAHFGNFQSCLCFPAWRCLTRFWGLECFLSQPLVVELQEDFMAEKYRRVCRRWNSLSSTERELVDEFGRFASYDAGNHLFSPKEEIANFSRLTQSIPYLIIAGGGQLEVFELRGRGLQQLREIVALAA